MPALSALTASCSISVYSAKPTSCISPDCESPEHLAGPADLEVVHREEEAGAELFHQLDRVEALGRVARDGFFVGYQQVRVGLVMRTADAPAQLVQLRKAEAVRPVDDDGVGARHVDAGLDDGRAQQDVEALLVKVAHDVLELALGHLPVGDPDLRFGHQFLRAARLRFSMVLTSLCRK